MILCVCVFAAERAATGQTTTGTISGHVADSQGLTLPGVTVSANSSNLQGVRTIVTSTNGDYMFTALPPGTGVPYGAVGSIATQPYVTNPGYVTPPGNSGGTAVSYYFTARDAYRTDGQRRTDFAANYTYHVRAAHDLQLFGQLQVLNVFNQFQLCGCGNTVFANGGAVI